MTSLSAVVPDETSPSWRSSWSTAVSDPRFSVEMRVRHVAIRDAVIVIDAKGEHVEYKIEVMTKGFQWFVFHRYSDFVGLHKELVKLFNLKRDMLPSKRVTGNLASGVIKDRRFALQRYLQRLVNSHPDVLFCRPLLDFLDVLKHDVVAVTGKLAKHFRERGEATLQQHRPVHLTPNQCRCIAKRRQLPMDAQVPAEVATEPLSAYGHPSYLPDLFEICQQMQRLVIAPRKLKGARQPEVYTDDSSIDISVFPSLTFLEIFYVPCTKIHHLNTVQQSLRHLKVSRCQVQSLRFILADAVAERAGPIKPTATGVDAWRVLAVSRLSAHKRTVRRWQLLESLNLSYNQIHTVDPSSLDLVPLLEILDLSCNNMVDINAWLYKGTPLPRLRKLDMSFNDLTSLVAPSPEELAAFPSRLSSFRRTPPATPANTKPIRVSAGWSRPSRSRGSPAGSSFTSPTKSSHSVSSLADIRSASPPTAGSATPTARHSSGGGANGREQQRHSGGRTATNNSGGGGDGGAYARDDDADEDDGGGGTAVEKPHGKHRGVAARKGAGAVAKPTPVQAGTRPTPDTIPPPKYTHPHLINTESPDASLQQLQLQRSRRLRDEMTRSGGGQTAVQGETAGDSGRPDAAGHEVDDDDDDELKPENGGQRGHRTGNRPTRALSYDNMESRLEKAAQQHQQQSEESQQGKQAQQLVEGTNDTQAHLSQPAASHANVEESAIAHAGGAHGKGDATTERVAAGEAQLHESRQPGDQSNACQSAGGDEGVHGTEAASGAASASSDELEGSVTPTPSKQQLHLSGASMRSEANTASGHTPSARCDENNDDDDDDEFDLLLEEDEEVQGTLNLSAAIEEREAWARRRRREEKKRQKLQGLKSQLEGARSTGRDDGEAGAWHDGDVAATKTPSMRSGGDGSSHRSFRDDSASMSSQPARQRHEEVGESWGGDTVSGSGGSSNRWGEEGARRTSGNGVSSPERWNTDSSSKSSGGNSRACGDANVFMRNGHVTTASTSTLDSLGRDSVFSYSDSNGNSAESQRGPRFNGNSGGGGGGSGATATGSGKARPGGRHLSISSDLAMLFPTTPPKRLCDIMPMLHELHLASNLLRSLDGLEGLRCLGYLDVRSNRLDQLAGLQALRTLPCLNQLRIQGNGVARQRRYRKSIWIFAGDAKFIIDGEEPPA